MLSTSSIDTFSTRFLTNTGIFSVVNAVIWGTRAATWLNSPASPIGIALFSVIQGAAVGFANTIWDIQNPDSVWDVQNPAIKIAITVGAVALSAFAAFLLAKPLAVYMGVITVKAAIASTVLCSLIKLVGSYGYRYLFSLPSGYEEMNKMAKEELRSVLSKM